MCSAERARQRRAENRARFFRERDAAACRSEVTERMPFGYVKFCSSPGTALLLARHHRSNQSYYRGRGPA